MMLSLVMIVKDEAKSIRRVLEAAKPFVDRWTVLDTGSTDGTQDIVREVMRDLPGALFEEPFVDFSTSRNRALELDNRVDAARFQLMLSGDEYLRDGKALRDHLENHRESDVDLHFIQLDLDDMRMFTPRVFRTGSDWKYEGAVHEVPFNRKDANAKIASVPGARIEHVVSDPESRLSGIWEKHIPLLQAALDENPYDERSLVFLAQSYESLFSGMAPWEQVKYATEAMTLYLRRLSINSGNAAERNWVMMHYLDCARIAGVYTPKELFDRCLELHNADPARPEHALLLAEVATKVLPAGKVYELALKAADIAANYKPTDSTPYSTSCAWRAHRLAAICAAQISAKHPNQDTGGGVTWEQRAAEHIKGGIATGGSEMYFAPIADKLSAKPAFV